MTVLCLILSDSIVTNSVFKKLLTAIVISPELNPTAGGKLIKLTLISYL